MCGVIFITVFNFDRRSLAVVSHKDDKPEHIFHLNSATGQGLNLKL